MVVVSRFLGGERLADGGEAEFAGEEVVGYSCVVAGAEVEVVRRFRARVGGGGLGGF